MPSPKKLKSFKNWQIGFDFRVVFKYIWNLLFGFLSELEIFEYPSIRIPFLKRIFDIRIPITPSGIVFDYQ
jgi:hypothetical protein